jgi:Mn-containing catalase
VYLHTQLLINEILPDESDPAAANALQAIPRVPI